MLLIAIIVFIIIVLVLLVSSFKLVSQTNMFVVERLGGYHTTWDVGIHLLIPFVDRVVSQVSMKEQLKDFAPQPVITKDNLTMQIDSVVFFQVTDPKLFAYGVNNPIGAIENLSATTLRNIIGDLDLDQTLSSRDLINTKMRAILDEATDPWGIKVNRVEIKNIIPPKDITAALEKQLRAEREKRESILNAEGDKQSAILRAEGEAEALILKATAEKQERILNAEGEAEAIYKLKEAESIGIKFIKEAKADQAVIQLKAFEALAKVADGQATKIIIPSNIADLSSLILSATEIGQTSKESLKSTKLKSE